MLVSLMRNEPMPGPARDDRDTELLTQNGAVRGPGHTAKYRAAPCRCPDRPGHRAHEPFRTPDAGRRTEAVDGSPLDRYPGMRVGDSATRAFDLCRDRGGVRSRRQTHVEDDFRRGRDDVGLRHT